MTKNLEDQIPQKKLGTLSRNYLLKQNKSKPKQRNKITRYRSFQRESLSIQSLEIVSMLRKLFQSIES